MSKLENLRTAPPATRGERSYSLCLAPEKVAEMQALATELQATLVSTVSRDDEDQQGPPRRLGEGEPPEAARIRERMQALLEEMDALSGELRLRANRTDGEWRRWADANPPRDKDQPGHSRDQQVTGGYCNTDALIEDLGTYALSWDGDALAEDDWANIFRDNIAPGDKKALARLVVEMYEGSLDFPSWRNALSASLKKFNDFDSPAPSESPTVDFTGGNPEPFIAAST